MSSKTRIREAAAADDAAIVDVTDTALWVAALRAAEGTRAQAAFNDPLASLLAGRRGALIARSFPQAAAISWGVVMRTTAIDRLVAEVLEQGVDSIVNLGAGLDTRPYRLNVPSSLRWIEVDFPSLMQRKERVLAPHAPKCQVERVGMNLLDRAARSAFFAEHAARGGRTALITEGMLPYWSAADAALLATDLSSIRCFEHWIADFDNAGSRRTPASWAKRLSAAPMLFRADDWFKFFLRCGWRRRKAITTAEESARLARPYPFAFPSSLIMRVLPADMRRRILSASGAAWLERG